MWSPNRTGTTARGHSSGFRRISFSRRSKASASEENGDAGQRASYADHHESGPPGSTADQQRKRIAAKKQHRDSDDIRDAQRRVCIADEEERDDDRER